MVDEHRVIGLSSNRTDHVIHRSGRSIFLCCAVDILLNADGPPTIGETRCPVCGRPILVSTRSGTVLSVAPAGAIVNAQEMTRLDGRREICCAGSAIFDSKRCLDLWGSLEANQSGPPAVRDSIEAYTRRCCEPGFRKRGRDDFPCDTR